MQTVLTAFYHLICHSNTSLQHKNRHLQCQDTSLYKKVTASAADTAKYKAQESSERNPCGPPRLLSHISHGNFKEIPTVILCTSILFPRNSIFVIQRHYPIFVRTFLGMIDHLLVHLVSV